MNSDKTIRERIGEYQNEILKGNLLRGRAAEMLTEISSLIGNLNDEIRIRDIKYNLVLMDCYNRETKANRAKILAETKPEYNDKRVARDTKELAIAIIQSLKYFLKAFEEEYKAGKNF